MGSPRGRRGCHLCEEQRGGPCGAPTGRAEAVSALVNLGGDTVVGSVHIFAADVGLGVGSDRTSGGGGWRGQRSPQVHCLGPQWTAAHAGGDPDLTEAWPISETPKREPPGPQAVWTEPSAEVASGEPQGYGARTRDRRRSLSGGGVGRGAGGRSRSGPVSQGGPGGGRVLNLS